MGARLWLVGSLAVITLLAGSRSSTASELLLTFQDGRVTLLARDVTVREILSEWERVGGTRIVNIDAAGDVRVTLDLVDVPEGRALATLLRQAAGYFAAERAGEFDADSRYARIVIMAGAPRVPAGRAAVLARGMGPSGGEAEFGTPPFRPREMSEGRAGNAGQGEGRPAAPPVGLGPPVGQDPSLVSEAPVSEASVSEIEPDGAPPLPPAPSQDPVFVAVQGPPMGPPPPGGFANWRAVPERGGVPDSASGRAGGAVPPPSAAQAAPGLPAPQAAPTVPTTTATAGGIIPKPEPPPVVYKAQGLPPPPPRKPPGIS